MVKMEPKAIILWKGLLRADDVCFHLLAAHLFGGQSHSTFIMPHERIDTDHTGHGDTTDTDTLAYSFEYKFGATFR